MIRSRPNLPLLLLLLLHACLGMALIAVVPPDAAPDEMAHWQYVEYIAVRQSLPIFRGEVPPAPGYEFHQPPLYYLLCAPLWSLLGAGIQNYACRVVSLLFSLLTLVVVWKAVRLYRPLQPSLALLGTGLVALSPVQLGIGASSNNDSLGGFWCALIFFFLAKGFLQGWSRLDQVALGLTMALGLATKNTTLVLVMATLAAAAHLYRARGGSHQTGVDRKGLVTIGLVFLCAAAPLALRNISLYGDPFGLLAFSQAATAGTPGYPLFAANGIGFVQYWRGILLCIFATMWGFWGGPNSAVQALSPLFPRPVEPWIMALMAAFASFKVVCLLGWLKIQRQPNIGVGSSGTGLGSRAGHPGLVLWWSLGTGLVVLAWIYFAFGHFSGGQARYLQPAILPVSAFLGVSWTAFWGDGRARIIASIVFGVLLLGLNLLNVLVWKTLV